MPVMTPPRNVTVADLRKKVQAPVRQYNDVAGYLVGDHLSIHVTRQFVRRGWSPTIATVALLVLGVGGSILMPFGERAAVFGMALVFLSYVADCVDGEVARFYLKEKLIWTFFVCLGILAYRELDSVWMLVPAFSALLATLFKKFLWDLPLVVASRQVVLKGSGDREKFSPQLVPDLDPGPVEVDLAPQEALGLRSLGSWRSIVRGALTNFDLSVLLFLIAAVADLFVSEGFLGGAPFKIGLLVYYGVALPLDYFDRLITSIRRGQLSREAAGLLKRAHHFRLR
jgi:hypothetical protein